jgi:GNAT superfamily N-acetyltransferase
MTDDTPKHGEIHIREMTTDDIPFLRSLTARVAQVGTPPWRDPAQMWEFHQQSIVEAITDTQADSPVLVAEDAQGARLGFIHPMRSEDFFTHEPQGYIADFAVSDKAEGKGVGRMLMERAEAWTRAQGYRILALNVFAMNTHARSFYQHLGYVEETLMLIKEL